MYEKIDINKFPFGVTTEFEEKKLPDNSLMLVRYKDIKTQQGPLSINKTKVDAVVIICRTSINHYVITGSTEKHTKIGYGKTIAEVATFIKRWFCRTLIEE